MKYNSTMKYTGIILSLLIGCGLFSSCDGDKRAIPDEMNVIKDTQMGVKEIKIEGVEDTYTLPSLGSLKISPIIKTGYPQDDLSYKWVMYSPSIKIDSRDEGAKAMVLGTEKDLDKPMTIASGRYKAYLKVTSKSTDVSAFYPFTVDIARVRGFFILKEIPEGNQTDIDFYSLPEDGAQPSLSNDIYKASFDQHLEGKPIALDVIYTQSFLDPDSLLIDKEEITHGNTFFVTTDKGDNKFIRYSDFSEVLKPDKRFYFLEIQDGMTYARAIRTYFHTALLTNKGVFGTYLGDIGSYRGSWGSPSDDTENSQIEHSFLSGGGSYLYYWNAQSKSIDLLIVAGDPIRLDTSFKSKVDGYGLKSLPYTPLFGGSFIGGGANEAISTFVLDDPATNKRLLYRFRNAALDSVEVYSGSSAIAKASHFAINTGASTTSAPILYCVVGNKIFGHNLWANIPDKDMTPSEIGPGETISYISCQFWKDSQEPDHDFDYLIIGTQKGTDYKIYMYKTIGGVPDGSPVHVFEGQGQVQRVCFAAPVFHRNKSKYSTPEK